MKKNIYLLVFLLIVGALLWWLKGINSGEEEWDEVRYFYRFNEENAWKWEVRFQGTNVVCEKTNGRWYIVKPRHYAASQDDVIANVKNFNTAEYLSVVGTTNDDLTPWGLFSPRNEYHLHLRKENGNTVFSIWEGRETGLKPNGFYIRTSISSNVYHVPEWLIKSFRKPVQMLRVKDFLRIEPETLTRLRYRDVDIQKSGLYWKLGKTPADQIDIKKVDNNIHNIAFLKAVMVWEQGDLGPGMEKLWPMFIDHTNNGKKQQFGVTYFKHHDRYFMSRSGRATLYELPADFHTNFFWDRSDLIK